MSINAPTEPEIRTTFLAKFDELGETRTEDRHPAPEFWQWLAHEGWHIHGIDSLAFADEAFDCWERANASDVNVARWVTDREVVPSRIYDTVAQVIEDGLSDLDYLIRRHVIQPMRIAS